MEEDDWKVSGEAVVPEMEDFPGTGYLSYDPNTLFVSPNRDGQRPVNAPVKMTGKFFGTRQPYIPTCSEPGPGNRGCDKWHGCKIGQMWKHVGPGTVRMKKNATVTFSKCYDYFETTRGGRPTTQNHYGLDGYKLATDDTTYDTLGYAWAVKAGLLNNKSTTQEIKSVGARVSKEEIGDLLPPWWPLMKKKGLPLPEAAEHYPELTEEKKPKKAKRG